MRQLISFVSTFSLLFSIGCASVPLQTPPVTNPPPSQQIKEQQVLPRDHVSIPGLVEGEDFSIQLPDGWVVDTKEVKGSGSARVVLNARSKSHMGDLPLALSVIEAKTDGDATAFVASVIQQTDADENSQIMAGKRVAISDDPGVELVVLHRLSSGVVVGGIELITANPVNGFVVLCVGDPNAGDELLSTCSQIVETVRMK